MSRLYDYLTGVDDLPQDIAWVLVDRIYRDTASLIGRTVAVSAFGCIGFTQSGSRWYLALVAYTLLLFAWRLRQRLAYKRAGHTGVPGDWTMRSLMTAWAAGVSWGAMSAAILFEPRPGMTTFLIGMHAGLVTGAFVHNGPVRPIAIGQNILASGPLFIICATSGSLILQVYAGMILFYVVSGMIISKALRQQLVNLLLREREKSDLAERLAAANRELAAVNEQLRTLAGTDALTGLANRRAFDLSLHAEWRRAQRDRTSLSLLMVDVDFFKSFNDLYGHLAGDTCLREVATIIAEAVRRPGDVPARYGGEEFAVILPNTDLDGAHGIAEDIRRRLLEHGRRHAASVFTCVTVSVGVGVMAPSADMSVEDLIRGTDAALYAAKRGGRNRVQASDDQHRIETAAVSML